MQSRLQRHRSLECRVYVVYAKVSIEASAAHPDCGTGVAVTTQHVVPVCF